MGGLGAAEDIGLLGCRSTYLEPVPTLVGGLGSAKDIRLLSLGLQGLSVEANRGCLVLSPSK